MSEVVYPLKGKRVWVAGHKGMVGSALVRRLAREDCEVLTVDRARRRSAAPGRGRSLARRASAGRDHPGGGQGRRHPRQRHHAGRIPLPKSDDRSQRDRRRPTAPTSTDCCSSARPASTRSSRPSRSREDALLTGPLEPTNEAYAIAKIAGIKLAQAYRKQYGRDYISAMPTNLYGPGDNFDPDQRPCAAGADPQGRRRAAKRASELTIWGSGNAAARIPPCRRLRRRLCFPSQGL